MKRIISLFLVLNFTFTANVYPLHDMLRAPIDKNTISRMNSELIKAKLDAIAEYFENMPDGWRGKIHVRFAFNDGLKGFDCTSMLTEPSATKQGRDGSPFLDFTLSYDIGPDVDVEKLIRHIELKMGDEGLFGTMDWQREHAASLREAVGLSAYAPSYVKNIVSFIASTTSSVREEEKPFLIQTVNILTEEGDSVGLEILENALLLKIKELEPQSKQESAFHALESVKKALQIVKQAEEDLPIRKHSEESAEGPRYVSGIVSFITSTIPESRNRIQPFLVAAIRLLSERENIKELEKLEGALVSEEIRLAPASKIDESSFNILLSVQDALKIVRKAKTEVIRIAIEGVSSELAGLLKFGKVSYSGIALKADNNDTVIEKNATGPGLDRVYIFRNTKFLRIVKTAISQSGSGREIYFPLGASKQKIQDKLIKLANLAKNDYADTGEFSESDRNAIFGLPETLDKTPKISSLERTRLDSWLDRPGAIYYIWDGFKLKRFEVPKESAKLEETRDLHNRIIYEYVTKDSKRLPFGESIAEYESRIQSTEHMRPSYSPARLEKKLEAIAKDTPGYILEYIPGEPDAIGGVSSDAVITPDTRQININGRKTNATRFSNMFIITKGLLDYSDSIAIAKIKHELEVFNAKVQGRKGGKQHIAGLKAEKDALDTSQVETFLDLISDGKRGKMLLPEIIDEFCAPVLTKKFRDILARTVSGSENNYSFLAAGVMSGWLLHVAEKTKNKDLAGNIARSYLEKQGKYIKIPEYLAMHFVLNKTGNKEDKMNSVKEILNIAVEKRTTDNWFYIKLALQLLSECDMPDEIKSNVSLEIAKLLDIQHNIYYEHVPAVLEKTGFSKETLEVTLNGKGIKGIMSLKPDIYTLPAIEMLAKFADKHKKLFDNILENNLNPYACLILLENMDAAYAKNKLQKLNSKYKGGRLQNLAGKMFEIHDMLNADLSDKRDVMALKGYLVSMLNNMPSAYDPEYYIYLCGKIADKVFKDEYSRKEGIPAELRNSIGEFITLLEDIVKKEKEGHPGHRVEVYKFAVKTLCDLSSYGYYRTEIFRALVKSVEAKESGLALAYDDVSNMALRAIYADLNSYKALYKTNVKLFSYHGLDDNFLLTAMLAELDEIQKVDYLKIVNDPAFIRIEEAMKDTNARLAAYKPGIIDKFNVLLLRFGWQNL